MISLRYYQADSIQQIRESFRDGHQRVVLCLPTGAGKTVVFSEMVRMAAGMGTTTMVITDRTELFKQTIKSLGRVGVSVEEISPNKKHIYPDATIYLAMVETLKRRKSLPIKPVFIIIDEAHKGNFTAVLNLYKDARVIGATASPEGKHFYEYYTHIVQNIDVPELVSEGFLVDCLAFQMQDDLSDLEVKAGKFTEESLMNHYDKPKLYDGVIREWNERGKGMKTICFNVNIEHTISMHKKFIEAGISSEYITSKTPKNERDRILASFKKGDFDVLNNCGILTTGYDEDTIRCVIMNRATKSLPLALQIPGRGSRPIDGCINGLHTAEERLEAIRKSSKPYFLYLDFGMNHDRHGLWNMPREWMLKKPREKGLGVAPVKYCENKECGCMIAASATICKFCGYEFAIKSVPLKEGIMVEVKPKVPDELKGRRISELSLEELIQLEYSKRYKPSYIWRVVRSRGESVVDEYQKLRGHSKGWAYRQKKNEMNNIGFTDYIIN